MYEIVTFAFKPFGLKHSGSISANTRKENFHQADFYIFMNNKNFWEYVWHC